MDRGEVWKRDGCRGTAEWLAAVCGISTWRARRLIGAAYALERLPRTSAALEAGSLSLDKTVELVRFAAPETEEKLVRWARSVTPARVRQRGDEAVAKPVESVAEADDRRHLRWWSADDIDALCIEGLLPSDAGAMFVEAIDRLAHELPQAPPSEDGDPPQDERICLDQRRADALVLLTTGASSDGDGPEPVEVVLHAPIESLAQDRGNCTIGSTVLHPETARRLSCDARLRVVLEKQNGDALGIGRASQIAPRWLRRQVLYRHGHTCSFPGCEMKRHLKLHHIKHWVPDGETTYWNLVPVCPFHHKLVHEHRWSVTLEGRRAVWFRPSGRRYDPGPPVQDAAPAPRSFHRIRISHPAAFAGVTELVLLLGRKPGSPEYERTPGVPRRRRSPPVERLASRGSP